MAYAEWYVTTTCATTSVTMFGTLGPWIELPDVFAPILWIDTTSPAGLSAGLRIVSETTSDVGNATQTVKQIVFEVQVSNYEPTTKWFLPSDCGTKTAGGALGQGPLENTAVGARLWKLWYRSVGDGPDPNRML